MVKKKKSSKKGGSDTVEIPVGKYVKAVKSNPWLVVSIVLALVLAWVWFAGAGGVSSGKAGDNLVDFINSQGQGTATLVSIEKEGSLYRAVVMYNGQQVPVFVSLDGEYLISNPVPLGDSAGAGGGDNNAGSGNSGEPVDIEAGDYPVKGDANAPVEIIEFSDYQCPFCTRFWSDTLPELDEKYIKTGKVKLVYKDFPLRQIHPEAQPAGEAAHCVRAQLGDEAYFEYHDILFGNQRELNNANYKKWARELGVSGAEFDSCLDNGEMKDKVDSAFTQGASFGVSGTPAFFVNGRIVEGAVPFSVFESLIEEELSK